MLSKLDTYVNKYIAKTRTIWDYDEDNFNDTIRQIRTLMISLRYLSDDYGMELCWIKDIYIFKLFPPIIIVRADT